MEYHLSQSHRYGTCIRPIFISKALSTMTFAPLSQSFGKFKHLLQRHVTGSLALKPCFIFRGSLFTLPRASPLAFHWTDHSCISDRWFLARRDPVESRLSMSNILSPINSLTMRYASALGALSANSAKAREKVDSLGISWFNTQPHRFRIWRRRRRSTRSRWECPILPSGLVPN